MSGTLRVTEIFRSIQGESARAGFPCAFIRLTGCSLRCVWCDSAYAFHGGAEMTVEEAAREVLALSTDLVEVTGGEPLEQDAVHALIDRLLAAARADDVGRIASLDHDGNFGGFAGAGRRDDGLSFSEEEDEEREEQAASHRDRGDPVRRPDDVQAHSSLRRLSLRLFPTTDTELAAMAAEAIIGERVQPVSG